MSAPLACTVRDCGLVLEPHGRSLRCARRHAYDIARSGYLNLLQPQDRRSREPGDAKHAVVARATLLAAGVGRTILEGFAARAAACDLPAGAVAVDLGTGSGDALAALAEERRIDGVGIDLSSAAIDHAARRFPSLTWVVANADRRLPLLDRTVDLVLSLHGRRNPPECARVLTRTGVVLVAVPARDDLIELRALVQGEAVERDRGDVLVQEHEPHFTLLERSSLRERHRLEREALLQLLQGTYRGGRTSAAPRIEALGAMEVTLASDLFLFARRDAP